MSWEDDWLEMAFENRISGDEGIDMEYDYWEDEDDE